MWTCRYREEVCCLEYYNPEYKDTILIGSGGVFMVRSQAFPNFIDAERYIIQKHKENLYPKEKEVYGVRDITSSWHRICSVNIAQDNIRVNSFLVEYTINYSLKRWEEFKLANQMEKIA
jgi:hypothetical protein